jgi:hypothetical protein
MKDHLAKISYITIYIIMKRPTRSLSDGKYHIDGKAYPELFGSRVQVWNGSAQKTPGLLTKKDLIYTKNHRIVSLKKHISAKREKRLEKHGYFTKKGKFGYVKRAIRKTRKNRK